MTHLRWIPCKYGCGSGFFTEQASKIHLKICSMASSARNHTEQPIPTELKELIRDVKACCSPRKSNTAADIATALYPLLLSSDGKKKFDALDEINRQSNQSRYRI